MVNARALVTVNSDYKHNASVASVVAIHLLRSVIMMKSHFIPIIAKRAKLIFDIEYLNVITCQRQQLRDGNIFSGKSVLK